MYYFDTETCGLHGPIVLLQYAKDDGDVVLHEVWREPVYLTLSIIEALADEGVIGFNLSFDWFHICQLYTTLTLLDDKSSAPDITEYAMKEPLGRDGPCLRPRHAFDIMCHARKGPYQSTMDRKPIYIKKVPRILAQPLCNELDKRIPLPDVYFAKAHDKTIRWQLSEDQNHYDPQFVDLKLSFKPSSGLKALAVDALKLDATDAFGDLDAPGKPLEYGYAPFALGVARPPDWAVKDRQRKSVWRFAWPKLIERHIEFWKYNQRARIYAENDVIYTRALYHHFEDPEIDDTDSVLSCMIGAVRWHGFSVDLNKLEGLRELAIKQSLGVPQAPRAVRGYLNVVLNETEQVVIADSTAKGVLEELSTWPDHPVAERAQKVLDARKATKEIELFDKIINAGRFHASFQAIGTFSSRMSGGGGDMNPQGVKKAKTVRAAFTLGWSFRGQGNQGNQGNQGTDDPTCPGLVDDLVLHGGDFDAFEVSIADKVYDDPKLHEQLCTCSNCGYICDDHEYQFTDMCSKCGGERRKIHGLLGMELSGLSYDEVVKSKGKDPDWYDKGKRGIFAMFYGGNYNTLMTRLNVTEEVARKAEENFLRRYSEIGRTRAEITKRFTSLVQRGEIGTRIDYREPEDYIESFLGFRRYFTLENSIIKALYTLASKLPPTWRQLEGQVVRRDRQQKIGGAVMSALFAAAFAIQGKVQRAAGNHVIQSPGATMTKELQRRLWELQPVGVSPWYVMPMNVHDEVMCPTCAGNATTEVVDKFLEEYRKKVPLLKLGWRQLNSWADK